MGNKVSSRSQRKNANTPSSLVSPPSLSSSPAVFSFSNRFQSCSSKVKKQKSAKEKKGKSTLQNKRIIKEKKNLISFLPVAPAAAPGPSVPTTLSDVSSKSKNAKNDIFSLNTQETTLQQENDVQSSVIETKTSILSNDFIEVNDLKCSIQSKVSCSRSSSFAPDNECDFNKIAKKVSNESICLCDDKISESSSSRVNSGNRSVLLLEEENDVRSNDKEEEESIDSFKNQQIFRYNKEEKQSNVELEVDSNWLPQTSSIDFYVAENKIVDSESDKLQRLSDSMYNSFNNKIKDEYSQDHEEEKHLFEVCSEKGNNINNFELNDESNKTDVGSLVDGCGSNKGSKEKSCSFYLEKEEKKEVKKKTERFAKICEENYTTTSSTTYTSVISSCIASPRSPRQITSAKEKQKDSSASDNKKCLADSNQYTTTSIHETNENVSSNDNNLDVGGDFSPNFLMEPTRAIQMWFSDILFSCAANNNSTEEGAQGNNRSTELVVVDDVTGYLTDSKSTITFCDDFHATSYTSPLHDNKKNGHYEERSVQSNGGDGYMNGGFTASSAANFHKSVPYEHYNIATPTSSRICVRVAEDNYNFNKNNNHSGGVDEENVLYFLPSEDPTGYLTDLAA